MNGPYASAEIRWFSKEKDQLLEFYTSLPEAGMGMQEPARSDLYLKTGLVNTGVKIREGNHEIKVKSASDENIGIGRIEQWVKWSTIEERNILNTIEEGQLDEWVRMDKLRSKKNYATHNSRQLIPCGEQLMAEGCSVEFTELIIPEKQLKIFTLGCESFSSSKSMLENLELALEYFGFNSCLFLSAMQSCGYPEFLKGID